MCHLPSVVETVESRVEEFRRKMPLQKIYRRKHRTVVKPARAISPRSARLSLARLLSETRGSTELTMPLSSPLSSTSGFFVYVQVSPHYCM